MKKFVLIICLSFLIVSIASSQEVVFYSNFENWTDGVPDDWFGSFTDIEADSVMPYTDDPYIGSTSCRIIVHGDQVNFSSQSFSAGSGKYYKVLFAIIGGFQSLDISLRNVENGSNISLSSISIPSMNDVVIDDWELLQRIKYIPEDNENFPEEFEAELVFRIQETNQDYDDITIDHVLLVELENPIDYLDVNNLYAPVDALGFLFYSPLVPAWGLEAPAGSGKKSIFVGTLWIGGKDEDENLYIAANKFAQRGLDFQSGPIANNYQMLDYIARYSNTWKINQYEIQNHILNYLEDDYEMSSGIKNWPGNGNIDNGEAEFLAPFTDLNNNGIYEPELGEFPIIRGDQAIYFIYNDDMLHTESGGESLGVEVHGMLYGFDNPNDSALHNTIFLSYEIFNRSDRTYHDLYIGKFVDFDIGNPTDDYVGCDTILNMFYGYNSNSFDTNYAGAQGYGDRPPAHGTGFLNYNLDGFIPFYNTAQGAHPATTDPVTAIEHYNILRGIWKDGTSLTYGGTGHYSSPNNNPDIEVNFAFPGYPETNTGWTEYGEGNPPDDRRGIGIIGPFDFYPGESICVDIAFPFARDYDGDHLSSVALLRERMSEVQSFYNNHIVSCISSVNPCEDVSIITEVQYPNDTNCDGQITVFSVKGNDTIQIDLPEYTQLCAGTYHIYVYDEYGCHHSETIILASDNQDIIDFADDFELEVYPNPFNNTININTSQLNDFEVTIIDISGKIVYQTYVTMTDYFSFNLGELQSGLYILLIKSESYSGKIKIIKQK